MKKNLLTLAVAAAIGTLASPAFAVIDISAAPTAAKLYAKELIIAPGTTTPITDDFLDITVPLGFGVSNTQTRYVRFDLINGNWNNNPTNPVDLTIPADPLANITLSAVTATYVIYQVTAGTNIAPTDLVAFALGTGVVADGVDVIDKTQSVSLKYSLYETGPAALAGDTGGRLSTQTGVIARIGTGIAFTTAQPLDPKTAEVSDLYKSFIVADGQNAAETLVEIGRVDVGAVPGVSDPSGAAVALSQLVDPGTKLVLTTSKTYASTTAGGLYLAFGGCTNAPVYLATGLTANTVNFVIDENTLPNANVCYQATGTTPIEVQDFTIALDVSPDAGPPVADTTDFPGIAVGSFDRNGTVLRAPFAQTNSSTFNWVQLTNVSGIAAPFTVTCFNETGTPVAGVTGQSVPANTSATWNMFNLCPTNAASTRAVEIILAVPRGSVMGSVVRQNKTEGTSGFDGMIGNSINGNN